MHKNSTDTLTLIGLKGCIFSIYAEVEFLSLILIHLLLGLCNIDKLKNKILLKNLLVVYYQLML